ncbi:MAG TPA: sugar ABC transporter substrate-binding protein [Firmicutes bacterium]|nr:sugar ABC transporter substrate-binding protein [Bacillota bacterium]
MQRRLVSLVAATVLVSLIVVAGTGLTSEAFKWDKYAGQTITVMLTQTPLSDGLRPLLSEFTKKTGIKVNYLVLAEAQYWNKLQIDLSSGAGEYDVFMSGPSFQWQWSLAGWIEPLDSYLSDKTKTSPDFDLADFYPAFLDANRWNGKSGGGLGEGKLWGMPVNTETTLLSYRKDVLAKYGLKPPSNWYEWAECARAVKEKSNGEYYGVVQRGAKDITSIQAGFISSLFTYGGKDFEKDLEPAMNSPKAKEFTRIWIDTIKAAGPPDWPSTMWYDEAQKFASGKYAMVVDGDNFVAMYEDPAKSKVAGKLGYAPIPKGPDGAIRSNIWTWGFAMNAKSRHKDAAWMFIQWASSKDTMARVTTAGSWPTRRSVWESDKLKALANWDNGNFYKVITSNYEKYAAWRPTPMTELPAVWDRWIMALHEIYFGQKSVDKALDDAAHDINQILIKAGLKK